MVLVGGDERNEGRHVRVLITHYQTQQSNVYGGSNGGNCGAVWINTKRVNLRYHWSNDLPLSFSVS